MKKELNSRQWALYNLLKNNPDRRFKQIDICFELPEFYPFDEWDLLHFHDSAVRLRITNDIRTINNSDIIQKIIIADKRGVKLASEEEFARYIAGQFAAIFRRLERTRKKARKGGLNGQLRLAFGEERDTVEAFADGISRLKAARLAKKLKLADVVKVMRQTEKGFDVSLLSKMERGQCKPTDAQLLRLAEIYEKSPLELIDGKLLGFDIIA